MNPIVIPPNRKANNMAFLLFSAKIHRNTLQRGNIHIL